MKMIDLEVNENIYAKSQRSNYLLVNICCQE